MKRLIDAEELKNRILGEPPEARYPHYYADIIDHMPDARIIELKTVDALVQAAYKAGKEGRPLMVALNEEVGMKAGEVTT